MSRLASFVALTLSLSACGGAAKHTPGSMAAPTRSHPWQNNAHTRGSEPSPRNTASLPSGAPLAESGSAFDRAESAERWSPQEDTLGRPGLGTEWGETQMSRVFNVVFERNDWANPNALATLYYNDAEGVQAMTRGGGFAASSRAGATVQGGSLSVRLVDPGGSPLPTYDVGSRTYVVGSHGDGYAIQIQNATPYRFEAVATVDGLDVMDGQPGSFRKRGYLVAPWSTVQIDGFRQSLDEVAAFRFGSVDDSYAARKGDARHVGVIGVAFFAERGSNAPWLGVESERRHRADPFPGRFASPPH